MNSDVEVLSLKGNFWAGSEIIWHTLPLKRKEILTILTFIMGAWKDLASLKGLISAPVPNRIWPVP